MSAVCGSARLRLGRRGRVGRSDGSRRRPVLMTRRRWVARFSAVLAVAVASPGLSVAAAQDRDGPVTDPFEMGRIAGAVDVRDLDEPEDASADQVARRLETANELGDFSHPPLQGDALAKAELARAVDIEARRAEVDRSFDRSRADKVEGATTANAEVFRNGDGTRTAVLSDGKVRFQDDQGAWVDYDLSLDREPSGALVAGASDVPVTVSDDPQAGQVTVGEGDAQVVFGLPSAAAGAE